MRHVDWHEGGHGVREPECVWHGERAAELRTNPADMIGVQMRDYHRGDLSCGHVESGGVSF